MVRRALAPADSFYWNAAGCEIPEAAIASPTSIPCAVNATGADAPINVRPPDVEAGSAIVTMGGTVNVPALAGAVQANIAPALPCCRGENPEMVTKPAGSPPVHDTVTPCVRSTVAALAALLQTIAGGMTI